MDFERKRRQRPRTEVESKGRFGTTVRGERRSAVKVAEVSIQNSPIHFCDDASCQFRREI